MKKYLWTLKRFLVLVTPAIASSMLVTSPSQAASIAYSGSTLNINNLSSSPSDISVLTDAVTKAISTGGQVSANAQADGKFNVDANNSASNSSFSQAQGQGYGYTGSAYSLATIVGYNFQVDNDFSFDFSGSFKLYTAIDNALTESAKAFGKLTLQLYDNNTGNLLDSFNIYGKLSTFGGTQDFSTTFNGSYSGVFNQPTSLTLVEVEENGAEVHAVPEPSTTLASLLSCTMLGAVWLQQKRKKASSVVLMVNKE